MPLPAMIRFDMARGQQRAARAKFQALDPSRLHHCVIRVGQHQPQLDSGAAMLVIWANSNSRLRLSRLLLSVALAVAVLVPWSASAQVNVAQPFRPLLGWWIGNGRLGFTNGKTETVRCRAVYRALKTGQQLRQVVRCASASGKVEVESSITLDDEKLHGTWSEKTYNFNGDLTGRMVPGGFRVKVSGSDVKANMTVVVRGDRHLVEIQFSASSLIGLTMVFNRGSDKKS